MTVECAVNQLLTCRTVRIVWLGKSVGGTVSSAASHSSARTLQVCACVLIPLAVVATRARCKGSCWTNEFARGHYHLPRRGQGNRPSLIDRSQQRGGPPPFDAACAPCRKVRGVAATTAQPYTALTRHCHAALGAKAAPHKRLFLCGKIGRDDRIRTCDPHTPSVMRYQAALRPDRQRARCACWKRAYMAALW
jgi:hypothetical protein